MQLIGTDPNNWAIKHVEAIDLLEVLTSLFTTSDAVLVGILVQDGMSLTRKTSK